MKQRVVIAIALACNPGLLIADEPTTALDVTIQAQVIEMMSRLKSELQTSMLLITHDLGVVAEMCEKVAIMYAGEIVEYGNLEDIYPHELDGGRRQRIGIARALALDPKFIVCDEPVSALDVSIQAQILNLMQDLQEQQGLTYMFITHNLAVVKHISDHIMVMYLGQMVELCSAKELFLKSLHPYTNALLSAIPQPDIRHKTERILLKGEISSPINPKPGCRFAARCNYATSECFERSPELREYCPGHFVACHNVERLGN